MSGLPRAIYDGTASCATCVLWRREGRPDTGTCYAEPPRMSGMRTVAEWPKTKSTDMCGKFAPAGDVELEKRDRMTHLLDVAATARPDRCMPDRCLWTAP